MSNITMIILDEKCLEDAKDTLYKICVRYEDNMWYTAHSYCQQKTDLEVTDPKLIETAEEIYTSPGN